MTRASASGREASAHRLAIEAARARLSTVVDDVQDQPVLLTRRGQPVAAIITMDQYDVLLAAEQRLSRLRSQAGSHRTPMITPHPVAATQEP